MNNILVLLTVFGAVILELSSEAPAVCRACRGHCKNNNEILLANVTETDFLDALVDNETGKLNFTENEKNNRTKRESYIEKRTCSSKFQLELFMIPICIAMIPIALISLLLCVFFCGPKDSRGQVPDKIMGVRLSQKRKIPENNDIKNFKKNQFDEELEYKDGYIQRKDSKKTRFATSISFIEPIRRASSISCLEGIASRETSGSSEEPVELQQLPKRKQTRFSDSISVLGESDDLPKRKPAIIQRSISVT